MRRARVISTFCACLIALPIASASAQEEDHTIQAPEAGPDEQEAQIRFELGRRYYETGRFLEAAAEFVAAIEIAPLAPLYYNLYLAYRDGGADEQAADALTLYIQTLPAGDRRTQLEARMRVLRERVSSGDDAGDTSETVESSGGEGGGGVDPGPWILVGAGGALVIGAVITGVLAMDERSSLDAMCPTPDTCPAGFEDVQSRGETLAIVTDVLWITGAVAVTAGIIWAIVSATGGDADSDVRAGFACDGNGCLGALRGEL